MVWYLTRPVVRASASSLLSLFCLYFFRDPERSIPDGAGGRIAGRRQGGGHSNRILRAPTRISIFLNIFDVHVNRAPIAGTITKVEYTKGQFMVASREIASSQNERNTVDHRGRRNQRRFLADRGADRAPHRLLKETGRSGRQGRARRADQVRLARGRLPWPRVGDRGRSLASASREAPASWRAESKSDGASSASRNDSSIRARPTRRPRRAAYALPTLFTAGNIFLGFLAILRSIQGALLGASGQLGSNAAFRSGRQSHRRGRGAGRTGWPHRAHDQHGQRFRPRDGFARRRHHLRHRARGSGIHPGVSQFVTPGGFLTGSPRRLFHRFSVFVLRRGAAGSLQCADQSRSQKSRPARPQIFRRPSHSGRGGYGRRRGLRLRQRAAGMVDPFGVCGWHCWRCSRS